MASLLDLLSLAAQENAEPAQDNNQTNEETVTTVVNIDSAPAVTTSKRQTSNPKVAGVKRKAVGSTRSNDGATTQQRLPASLVNILSSAASPPSSSLADLQIPPTPLPEDSGIIRCICIFDDDDGFSIQCETCFAWQHGLCVNVSPDAVPESYVCPMCAASHPSNGSASPRKKGSRASTQPGVVGISRADRDRATQLQRLRKEAEATLRRQRIELGLPLSSADGQFGGIQQNTTSEQQLQDEEYELLAQARGLAYQQSKNMKLAVPGYSSSTTAPDSSLQQSHNAVDARRSKSHSPAGQQVLQPSAPILQHSTTYSGSSGLSDVNASYLQQPSVTTAKKRRSGQLSTAAVMGASSKEDTKSINNARLLDSPGINAIGIKDTPQPRKRRSAAGTLSANQAKLAEKGAALGEALLGNQGNLDAIGSAGQLDSFLSGSGNGKPSGVIGNATPGSAKETQLRPSRSRMTSSLGASASASNQSLGNNNNAFNTNQALINDLSNTSSAINVGSQALPTPNTNTRDGFISSEDDADIDERYEPWQFEYTPITKLKWSNQALNNKIQKLVQRFVEEERENLVDLSSVTVMPEVRDSNETSQTPAFTNGSATESSNRPRPGILTSASFLGAHLSTSRNESPGPSSGSSTPIYSSSGVAPALSSPVAPAFLSISSSSLSSLQADLPRLSIKPLATSSLSLAPPACTPFSGPTCVPSLMNPYPRPTIHGVFTTCSYHSGNLIQIMNGQIISGDEYRKDSINQWNDMGLLKNHTRGLGQPWDIVLDQRKWGDETRFVRQGCHPNVYVRPVIIRTNKDGNDTTGSNATVMPAERAGGNGKKFGKKAIKKVMNASNTGLRSASLEEGDEWELVFGLYALQDISKREELVLPFDWADDHVVHSLHTLLFSPSLVFPDIPSNLHSAADTDTSDDEGAHRPTHQNNNNNSAFSTLTQAQRTAIMSATRHLYKLSRLANTTCLNLLGTNLCACEKRRDCAISWLWKLA